MSERGNPYNELSVISNSITDNYLFTRFIKIPLSQDTAVSNFTQLLIGTDFRKIFDTEAFW